MYVLLANSLEDPVTASCKWTKTLSLVVGSTFLSSMVMLFPVADTPESPLKLNVSPLLLIAKLISAAIS